MYEVPGRHPLRDLRVRLQHAHRIVVFSGAGMSAESGIATFRNAQAGLWTDVDPMQWASEVGFRADPARVWAWYEQRRAAVRQAEPNDGHRALARFSARHPGVLGIVTQNVDDLHQRAGSPEVIRLHGDLLADRWLEACPHTVEADATACEVGGGAPPRCRHCGNLRRPAVVWFGENLPFDAITAAEGAVSEADEVLVVGTSGTVWPAAGLVVRARQAGAHVVVVNPEPTELDDEAHLVLTGTAAALLPRLFDPL
jgi:NAD-dependent deacetylase